MSDSYNDPQNQSTDSEGEDLIITETSEDDVVNQRMPSMTLDLDYKLRIQVLDFGGNSSIQTSKMDVNLSDDVLTKVLKVASENKLLKPICGALNKQRKLRLLPGRSGPISDCVVQPGDTFRYIASLFEIRCPYHVPQTIFFQVNTTNSQRAARESSKTVTISEIPCFFLHFYNSHFIGDFLAANGRWNRTEEIYFNKSEVGLVLRRRFRAVESSSIKGDRKIDTKSEKSGESITPSKVSVTLHYPGELVVSSWQRANAEGGKQNAHISSYSLVARRIMRTCKPKLHGTVLTLNLTPLLDFIGCIFVCLAGFTQNEEHLKKQYMFINRIRQISCVSNCLQPILAELTWILQQFFNTIPEMTYTFESEDLKGYNITKKSSEKIAEHIDFVAALKSSESGGRCDIKKLSLLIARHLYLWGPEGSDQSPDVGYDPKKQTSLSEQYVKESIDDMIALFKKEIDNKHSNKEAFRELLEEFEGNVEGKITHEMKSINKTIRKWKRQQQDFYNKHADVLDLWSKKVTMPFKQPVERKAPADVKHISKELIQEIDETSDELQNFQFSETADVVTLTLKLRHLSNNLSSYIHKLT
ncbi:hypothetical protein GUITHDRAFT_141743 [Guillardia theta CCMP2712]|uniref:Uncharacterized protein n=1 Tax=Guillardia theta (strain CCMP2712) TaxID=905079 RepID=L1J0X7_GUITC|nr:hypothetical protein GUITHDRAFT_141743 [Guillardia theta CCMP2712]EKX41745.1 hypothetical protein GUITHDRAFT_141743 [Guillardia theta CCMP2712]|eukprot:XP_005828725.1 hypothetical protein GUITHDRAFT_141743 [Guillardia theta CCMP2712]